MRILKSSLNILLKLAVVVILLVILALLLFRVQAAFRESKTNIEAAPSTGHFVKVGDEKVFVQEAGPGNGPTVILIHPAGGWSEIWRSTMNALAENGYRAIALDLPPLGYSDKPTTATYSKTEQAHRIIGVLDSLEVSRAIFVGHSFGAGATMEALFLAPERVDALVLADAVITLKTGTESQVKDPLLMGVVFKVTPARNVLVSSVLTNPLFTKSLFKLFVKDPSIITKEVLESYRKPWVIEGTTDAVGDWLPYLIADKRMYLSNKLENYQALKVPTLIVWGEEDSVTPLEGGRKLAEIIPGAELKIMKNVNHMPQMEKPDEFNELLLTFLVGLKK